MKFQKWLAGLGMLLLIGGISVTPLQAPSAAAG
jgi:hypothetical protein